MRPFLKKFSLFLVSVLVLLMASDLIVIPQFAGRQFNEKYQYFSKNSYKYNLVFFGSSQVLRHFIPDTIDTKVNVSSFNYGNAGLAGFSRTTVFEDLLDEGHFDDTEYLLMEMGFYLPLPYIDNLMKMDRNRLLFTMQSYKGHVSYLYNLDVGKWPKLTAFAKLSRIYLKSRIKIPTYEYGKEILNSSITNKPINEIEYHGYLPFDNTDPLLSKRHNDFANNIALFNRLVEKVVENYRNNTKTNEALLAPYLDLIERCNKRGIKLIWVLNPIVDFSTNPLNETSNLKKIFSELPENNRIDLGSPTLHPEFYSKKYRFDMGHLNNEGAKIYSVELAKQLNRIIHK